MEDNQEYKSVGDITKKELAGCDSVMEWPGNFEVLRDRLGLLIALFRAMAIAGSIQKQIEKEAKKLPTKYHEYVINELQYEYRLASAWGKDNTVNEERLLSIYGRWLEKRFPATMIAQILETTRANRAKRVRTAPAENP